MPIIGPGDDILDAIEAGKGDDILMKDFKLNTDQVKAFRGLYYGLTNNKMKYEEINDYYPELKSYFTAPTLQQAQEAPTATKADFTKVPKQKAIAESAAIAPGQKPALKGPSQQELLDKKLVQSKDAIYKSINEDSDVMERMIRNQRYATAEQQAMDKFAGAPRTDMPAANLLAGMRNQIEPEVRAQDLPVTPEEINQLSQEIKTNEPQARQFINQVIVQKPEKAKELQSSIYALDASLRLQENPQAGDKIYDNIKKLENDELKYNAQTRQLVKELDFFPALVAGVKQRAESLEGYKMLQLPKDQVIKIMEHKLANYDPDVPAEVPKGAGEIGQMFGTEWASLLKGVATSMVTGAAGAEAAAPYITAAINAPEYYKRGFDAAFNQTYAELRREGKTEDEAYEAAIKQAKIEARYDAAEGFISSYFGGRIGIKDLPKFNITGGFKNAVKNVISSSGNFIKETAVEGITDGLIAGYLQDKKNEAAREAGLFRSDDSVREAITGEITFALAMGGLSQAGRALVDPKTYNKLLYWITRQPKETTEAKVGEMVMNGELSKEDADDILSRVNEQRKVDKTIPDDIKDVSRMAMADKIARRQELEKRLETEDPALHPPIKEEIKKLNEEILEHSKHKKTENESEAEAKTQAETEGTGVEPIAEAQPTATDVQTEAPPESTQQVSQPGAAGELTVEGEAAPVGEQYWTNPSSGQQFIMRDGRLYTKSADGKETAFTDKAMQSKHAKEIVAKMQAAGQQQAATTEQFPEQGQGGSDPVTNIRATPQQAAFYESNAGATPAPTGRVPIDPIVAPEGYQPKKLRQIVKDVSVGLKQRIIYAKTGRRGGIGAYMPWFKGIKIKRNNDLDTTAHELGHAIDDHFDLYNKINQNPAALQELDQFASYGSTPPKGHSNPRKYIDQEGFAEWLRAYIVNPTQAEQMAPNITAIYKANTSDKFQETIKQFSDDIRLLQGSNASDIMKANIDFEPDKPKGLLGQLFKREETNNNFSISWVNKLAAIATNPLAAFEQAFKYARGLRGLDEVLPEKDPLILSRVLLGIDGKYGEILQSGMINGRGDVLLDDNGEPMTLNWLIGTLDNTTMNSFRQDMEDAIVFMVAQRTVELSKKLGRGDELTGTGGGLVSDYSVAQRALNEFYNGDPNRLARIEEAARRYRKLADAMLSYAVDKGRLSQEAYEYITDNNEHYVALQRVMETAPGQEIADVSRAAASLGSKGEIIYRVKGSTKTIRNPYLPLLESLYKIIRESDRNDVLRAFRDLLIDPRGMNEGDPKSYADIGVIAAPGDTDSDTIPIFINGKLEKWIFQKDVHEQLRGLDKEAYRLPELLTWPAQAVRLFTTHFPAFPVRNWIRDTPDRIIKSTTGSGFRDLIGSQEDWHAIARAGGLNSGHYTKDKHYYYGLMTEAMAGMVKDKRFILADPAMLKRMWHKYTDLLYKAETSNRVAEYRSAFKEAKKKGMDDYNASLYAAYKARNLIDFAIMGNWMKIANQIIPFSNAAVQGLRSAAYSWQHNKAGFTARIMIYSVLPGIAAWMWNHRNEDDEKWYEELPGYQRDLFWNFRVGPNNWLSIPKPYELAIPQMAIDRMLSYKYTGNKKAMEGLGEEVIKLLSPFDEGNIAGPYQAIIEGIANWDFFRERTLISPKEDPLILALRNTETASRLGQLLQKYTSIDGRKWDHFIKRQFSYTGNFVLKLSDLGREDSRQEFDFTDTGLFKRTPAYNAVSVQRMIKYAKGHGLTYTPAYKSFNEIVGRYFNANDDEQREEIAKEMINYAKELYTTWEKEKMDLYKIEQAEEKKKVRAEEKQKAKDALQNK